MNIYSCVDYKNIDKLIVLFNSCYLNCLEKNTLKFYILTDNENYEKPFIPKYLENIITIKHVVFNEKWTELLNNFNENFYQNCSWCKNNMNFARFLFFNVFPHIDRAIYLDWDMIVQGNIYELYNEYNSNEEMVISKINERSIYDNIFNQNFKGNIYSRNTTKINNVIQLLNLNLIQLKTIPHFCSGFYIISKQHFEENYLIKFIENLINVQKTYKCFNLGTQAVMNLMHLDKRIFVDRCWNLTPDKDDINKIKIIHWNGHSKPWNDKDKDLNKIWWKYSNIINK